MTDNNPEKIISLISETLSEIDGSAYPETAETLGSAIEEEYGDFSAYGLSLSLTEADKPACFPEPVKKLISDLLEYEISLGNPDAMNDLGALFYEGTRGFGQDFTKAVSYYEAAAERGSRKAQENLGYCYYYGRAGEKDYEKAFRYFSLGAFDGHIISLYKIGDMYRYGYFVEKNETESFRIYTHCLSLMDETTAPDSAGPLFLRLGDAYFDGIGTEKDIIKSLEFYQRAEIFLYNMVKAGNAMYREELEQAISRQESARKLLLCDLPNEPWLEKIVP